MPFGSGPRYTVPYVRALWTVSLLWTLKETLLQKVFRYELYIRNQWVKKHLLQLLLLHFKGPWNLYPLTPNKGLCWPYKYENFLLSYKSCHPGHFSILTYRVGGLRRPILTGKCNRHTSPVSIPFTLLAYEVQRWPVELKHNTRIKALGDIKK